MQTAWGWNLWGKMEMEPSTGTFMALGCTKKSLFWERKFSSGENQQHLCIFVQHSITEYCHGTCFLWCSCGCASCVTGKSLMFIFSFVNESVSHYLWNGWFKRFLYSLCAFKQWSNWSIAAREEEKGKATKKEKVWRPLSKVGGKTNYYWVIWRISGTWNNSYDTQMS